MLTVEVDMWHYIKNKKIEKKKLNKNWCVLSLEGDSATSWANPQIVFDEF